MSASLPPRSEGPFWGPITANYDWCESNYVVTQYVAEFFNTLSSVPTLTVGLYFALKSAKHGYGFRFALAGWMLAVVGFGSPARRRARHAHARGQMLGARCGDSQLRPGVAARFRRRRARRRTERAAGRPALYGVGGNADQRGNGRSRFARRVRARRRAAVAEDQPRRRLEQGRRRGRGVGLGPRAREQPADCAVPERGDI